MSEGEIPLSLTGNDSSDTACSPRRQRSLLDFFAGLRSSTQHHLEEHECQPLSTGPSLRMQASPEEVNLTVESALSLYVEDELNPGITLNKRFCSTWPAQSTTCQAEFIAQRCIQQGRISYAQLRQIMVLLPIQQATRNISESHSGPTVPCYFCVGAYIFSSQAGVQTLTRRYEWVTRLLCCLLRSLCTDPVFSTVFLSYNVASKPHVDCHNHQAVPNYLVPLSRWEGGELWVSHSRGSTQLEPAGPCGEVMPISLPYTAFSARRIHAVLPWEGDRFLLGAYHIRDDWRLREESSEYLTQQGFRLSHLLPAESDPYQ